MQEPLLVGQAASEGEELVDRLGLGSLRGRLRHHGAGRKHLEEVPEGAAQQRGEARVVAAHTGHVPAVRVPQVEELAQGLERVVRVAEEGLRLRHLVEVEIADLGDAGHELAGVSEVDDRALDEHGAGARELLAHRVDPFAEQRVAAP